MEVLQNQGPVESMRQLLSIACQGENEKEWPPEIPLSIVPRKRRKEGKGKYGGKEFHLPSVFLVGWSAGRLQCDQIVPFRPGHQNSKTKKYGHPDGQELMPKRCCR